MFELSSQKTHFAHLYRISDSFSSFRDPSVNSTELKPKFS